MVFEEAGREHRAKQQQNKGGGEARSKLWKQATRATLAQAAAGAAAQAAVDAADAAAVAPSSAPAPSTAFGMVGAGAMALAQSPDKLLTGAGVGLANQVAGITRVGADGVAGVIGRGADALDTHANLKDEYASLNKEMTKILSELEALYEEPGASAGLIRPH